MLRCQQRAVSAVQVWNSSSTEAEAKGLKEFNCCANGLLWINQVYSTEKHFSGKWMDGKSSQLWLNHNQFHPWELRNTSVKISCELGFRAWRLYQIIVVFRYACILAVNSIAVPNGTTYNFPQTSSFHKLDNDRELLPARPCTCSLRKPKPYRNAKFDVAEGPNSEDELGPSGKLIGVFWALLSGYGGGWSRDDHSRCGSMRIAHSARKKSQSSGFSMRSWVLAAISLLTPKWQPATEAQRLYMNLSSQWSDTHFSGSP